ncbi:glucose-1-phosphate thymidylyltransferase [Streptomyces zinciresistens K42]|uniref:Glucose-1-phosphate thymidylyltransferase n=1 Tax=Streptomyces zinciresistens K42 TaxID=700597 RepID=G2G7G0_9ACTN|nr:glucose-1-phosphate thymidylyltransferase [Streptomyces zinciresistens K42]
MNDKPLIYYPLSALMLADIREILIVALPGDIPQIRQLLGDGNQLGLSLTYAEQPVPEGLAQAFLIGADHIGDDDVALVLGDNIFHGNGFYDLLATHRQHLDGCVLFGYPVTDPERYGVGEVDEDGRLVSLAEKPEKPRSNLAITGLYLYSNDVVEIARQIRPSPRGELEITEVNQVYLNAGRAQLVSFGRGFAWLDAGTPESLLQAGQYVQTMEDRQGVRIACLEEVALRMGFIDAEACHRLGAKLSRSGYGSYVMSVADEMRP